MTAGRRISDFDLVAYIDDELDLEAREEVEIQLASDAFLAARVEFWRRNDELLRAALARVASEPLPPSLQLNQRLGPRVETPSPREDAPIPAPIRQVQRLKRIRREQREKLVALTVASFAAGAVAMLVAAGFTTLAPRILATPAAYVFPGAAAEIAGERIAHRAMEAFWTFGTDEQRPAEVSSPSEIASWLTRRVGAPVRAPDLSRLRLRLLGGRLTPGDLGPAAFILYQTPAGNRIGLYIGRTSSEDKGFHYAEDRVTGAVWWLERGASFAIVGRADKVGLFKVARLVRVQEPAHAHRLATPADGD